MHDAGAGSVLAEEIVRILSSQRKTIVLAESCTGGLAADLIVSVPGASKVFWGSFVTYTVDAKTKMLAVPEDLIKTHGAVSRPVALAMAEGALKKSGASLAFSVTGLAGPEGDGSEVPTGTVWIGIADRNERAANHEAKTFRFIGSRNEVRQAAAIAVLDEILKWIHRSESRKKDIDNGEVLA